MHTHVQLNARSLNTNTRTHSHTRNEYIVTIRTHQKRGEREKQSNKKVKQAKRKQNYTIETVRLCAYGLVWWRAWCGIGWMRCGVWYTGCWTFVWVRSSPVHICNILFICVHVLMCVSWFAWIIDAMPKMKMRKINSIRKEIEWKRNVFLCVCVLRVALPSNIIYNIRAISTVPPLVFRLSKLYYIGCNLTSLLTTTDVIVRKLFCGDSHTVKDSHSNGSATC